MPLRIALGQFNACVGDVFGNIETMRCFYDRAVKAGADILVFPEMCICGYPPEDLLLKDHFLSDTRKALEVLAADCTKMTVITGFAEAKDDKCFNSLAVLQKGGIKNIYRKSILPNYEVFDEQRYFTPGTEPLVIDIKGASVGFTVCEDIWELERLNEFLKQTKEIIKSGAIGLAIGRNVWQNKEPSNITNKIKKEVFK